MGSPAVAGHSPSFFGTYGRFLQRARLSTELAYSCAEQRGHQRLEPQHILLGILEQGSKFGVAILEGLGASPDEMILRVNDLESPGADPSYNLPFDAVVTEPSKRVLCLAAREAANLGHTYMGTEHILYGLAAENESIAAEVLATFGVSPEAVRRVHLELISTWVTADAVSSRGMRSEN